MKDKNVPGHYDAQFSVETFRVPPLTLYMFFSGRTLRI